METGKCLQPKGAGTALPYLLQKKTLLWGSGSTQGSCSMDSWLMDVPHQHGPISPECQAHRTLVLPSRLEGQPAPSLGTGISPVPAARVLCTIPPAPEVGTDGSCQRFSGHRCFLSRQLLWRSEQNILLSQEFSASPPSSDPVPPFWLCRSHCCSGIVLVLSISVRW